MVALLVAGVGIGARYAFFTSADQTATAQAPRISDRSFSAAAVVVCKKYVEEFNTATTLGHFPSKDRTGDFLNTIATTFDQLVVELRALPVAATDQSAVAQWFADWDAYNTYGHRYAAAARAGAERDLVAHDSKMIGTLLRRRNAFAKANHMATCAFS